MSAWISIIIASIALAVSTITAWLTLFRRGELKMTQPTVIVLGPDGQGGDDHYRLKVFLRTLLYSTARSGQTVESLHLNVQRVESRQNFSIWVYGEKQLARGSGLFVSADGVACNHHFLLPQDGAEFRLLAGDYIMRVVAKRVRDLLPRQLMEVRLRISELQAKVLKDSQAGIYFDWGSDQQAYHPHVEMRPPGPLPKGLFEAASQPA